jgi:Domain of Unknown Function (DUF1080)
MPHKVDHLAKVLVILCFTICTWNCRAEEPFEVESGFNLLFDGKSLAGWEGSPDYFRIENEAIVAGSLKREIPRNEFLCTKQEFSNFDLRLEAKLVGKGDNAGIQFRSRRIPDHHEMIGYQCDIGLIGPKQSIWGALYDESRRRKFLAEAPADSFKLVKHENWNKLRILAEGKRIQLFVNDQLTVDYTEQDAAIEQVGLIGLQIHSGSASEASYRRLRIKELP